MVLLWVMQRTLNMSQGAPGGRQRGLLFCYRRCGGPQSQTSIFHVWPSTQSIDFCFQSVVLCCSGQGPDGDMGSSPTSPLTSWLDERGEPLTELWCPAVCP